MRRVDRLELLLRVLRDRPGVTAAELADDLGTSRRSIFRDLAYLRDRGYPIEASRGRGGGLRLHPNWGLGRVLLSTEEALGTLLSLAVAERLGLPMFASDLERARRKIVDAFPVAERKRLTPLRARILVGPPASVAVRSSHRPARPEVSRALQAAFVREHVVHADYVREDGERSTRTLEPHAIVLHWPAWYVLGHDRLRDAVRTFRLDRFVAVRDAGEAFRPRPHAMLRAVEGFEPDDRATWRL